VSGASEGEPGIGSIRVLGALSGESDGIVSALSVVGATALLSRSD
jgi:hypothetical protein